MAHQIIARLLARSLGLSHHFRTIVCLRAQLNLFATPGNSADQRSELIGKLDLTGCSLTLMAAKIANKASRLLGQPSSPDRAIKRLPIEAAPKLTPVDGIIAALLTSTHYRLL